jgi:hypothetical protein
MVTQFEEALNILDAVQNTIRVSMQCYEADGLIMGVLWGVDHLLDNAINILQDIEQEETEKAVKELDAFPTISYETLAARQYEESEEKEAAEKKEETEEPPAKPEQVKVDLKDVHKLRMSGKKAKDIADSYGVTVTTVYGWFDKIKKKHPNWAEEWVRK